MKRNPAQIPLEPPFPKLYASFPVKAKETNDFFASLVALAEQCNRVLMVKLRQLERRSGDSSAKQTFSASSELERLASADKSARRGFEELYSAAANGSEMAYEHLVSSISFAVMRIVALRVQQPTLTERVASLVNFWPVLAAPSSDGTNTIVNAVVPKELGSNVTLKTKLRSPRGVDVNHCARLWAKLAIETLEQTRERLGFIALLSREIVALNRHREFQTISSAVPQWVEKAWTLEPLSKSTLPKWKEALREMIREQKPNFHMHPDWKSASRRTERSKGPGTIQTRILRDVTDALETLVPGPSE